MLTLIYEFFVVALEKKKEGVGEILILLLTLNVA